MEEKEFKSEHTWDLETYEEFSKGYMKSKRISTVLSIYYFLMCIYLLSMGQYKLNLFISIFVLGICLASKKSKGKNIQYNRMLLANKNKPPHIITTISKDGIRVINVDTNNKDEYDFDQIISLAETRNLLILKFKYNLGIVMNKNKLEGGNIEELTQFLLDNCPNIKKKKVHNGKRNPKLEMAYIILLIFIVIMSLVMFIRESTRVRRFENTLDNNNYSIVDIKSLYSDSNIEYAIQVEKEEVMAYIYEFDNFRSAEHNFEYWSDLEFENSNVGTKEECFSIERGVRKYEFETTEGYAILVLDNNNNLFYGTTVNGTKEKLYKLFELWNDC